MVLRMTFVMPTTPALRHALQDIQKLLKGNVIRKP